MIIVIINILKELVIQQAFETINKPTDNKFIAELFLNFFENKIDNH